MQILSDYGEKRPGAAREVRPQPKCALCVCRRPECYRSHYLQLLPGLLRAHQLLLLPRLLRQVSRSVVNTHTRTRPHPSMFLGHTFTGIQDRESIGLLSILAVVSPGQDGVRHTGTTTCGCR